MNKKIILLLFMYSFIVNSTELSIGRIVDIKGEGFISREGKTKEIRKGDQVFANSEIVVEHSGQVTFTDNADHRFYLGNSSSVAVYTNTVELRNGDVWFQSINKSENYQIKTANALIDYQGGEGILSYDVNKSKTQLMVISGMMKFSNMRTPELNLSVGEGNFSFIDMAYEEGAPRDPTPVGEKTYKQLIGMFNGVSPLDKKSDVLFKHEETQHEEIKHELATDTPKHKEVKREVASETHEEKNEKYNATAEVEAYREILKAEYFSHVTVQKNKAKKNSKNLAKSTRKSSKYIEKGLVNVELKIYAQKKDSPTTELPKAEVMKSEIEKTSVAGFAERNIDGAAGLATESAKRMPASIPEKETNDPVANSQKSFREKEKAKAKATEDLLQSLRNL